MFRNNSGDKYTQFSDRDYLSAVESGDMETAQRMVDEAAKEAMKNTKILDEDGNLLVVYHGTDQAFTVFDRTKSRANMDIQGNFFSPWKIDAAGYGPNVRKYFLNITNPANESIGYRALNKFKGKNNAGVKAREYLESLGYDGVNNENEEYIAFYPSQIKSADPVTYDDQGNVIPLSERFNPEQEDIRYSERDYDTPTDTDLLMNASESAATNQNQLGLLKDYKALGKRADILQKRLDALMQEKADREASGKEYKAGYLKIKESEIAKLERELEAVHTSMEKKMLTPQLFKLLEAERDAAAKVAVERKEEVFQRYKERKQETAIRNRIANLNGLNDAQKLPGGGDVRQPPLAVRRLQLQLLTSCKQLIGTFHKHSFFQNRPIRAGAASVGLLRQNADNVSNGKQPFFVFRVPCGANLLILK